MSVLRREWSHGVKRVSLVLPGNSAVGIESPRIFKVRLLPPSLTSYDLEIHFSYLNGGSDTTLTELA